MTRHENKSWVLYLVIIVLFLLCTTATYYNLVVLKNFKQFTIEEEEPSPFNFYLHNKKLNINSYD
jgi:hypothetical protein